MKPEDVERYVAERHAELRAEQDRHLAALEAPPLLHSLRSQIDEVDGALAALLRRRMVLVEAVAFVKRVAGIEAHDPKRETDLIARFCPTAGPAQDAYREVIRVGRQLVQKQNGERIELVVPVPSPDDAGGPVDVSVRTEGG